MRRVDEMERNVRPRTGEAQPSGSSQSGCHGDRTGQPTEQPPPSTGQGLGLRGGGQIFVKGLNGQKMVLDDVRPWTSILDIKLLILRKLGYIFTQPPDIRLIFGGRSLDDIMCLCDYNIVPGNTIFLIFRLPGGMDEGLLLRIRKNGFL